MEMVKLGDLSFSILLRFFSPLIIYFYIYISNPSQATSWITDLVDKLVYLGNIEKGSSLLLGSCIFLIFILSIVVGSIIFLIYRNLCYELIIRPGQDILRYCRKSENQRTRIRKLCKNKITKTQSMLIWHQIKIKYLEEHYPEMMEIYGSNIHLLYLSGFIAISFYIFSLLFNVKGAQYVIPLPVISTSLSLSSKTVILLLGLGLSLIGALADWNYETRELSSLCPIHPLKIKKFVNRIIKYACWGNPIAGTRTWSNRSKNFFTRKRS